ncbi:hypothetical protein [Chitinilyticum litopenaei]|uniref:hypothetical protein n=1 Tax=Chitinilyticum litopenaei TaxID=1121276 RepID=UPI00048DB064|nr:hypothetical protein [Chitinilyticum litopenaei]
MTLNRSRLALLAMFGLTALPFALAQWSYQQLRQAPPGAHTVGTLQVAPALPATGQWRLLALSADCRALAGLSIQADRIRRAQPPQASRLQLEQACASRLDTGLQLVDPHGNAVLFYAQAQLDDATVRGRVIREIGQVLRRNPALGARRPT